MPAYHIGYTFVDEENKNHFDTFNYHYKNIKNQSDLNDLHDIVKKYVENYFCGAVNNLRILSFSKFE